MPSTNTKAVKALTKADVVALFDRCLATGGESWARLAVLVDAGTTAEAGGDKSSDDQPDKLAPEAHWTDSVAHSQKTITVSELESFKAESLVFRTFPPAE